MDVLKLAIPPLPQFLTIGRSVWAPGMQHFERAFPVYDMLLVGSGALYMTEEEREYEILPGTMLLLEPDKRHVGHRPCAEPTLIYWVHFSHAPACGRMTEKEVAWSVRVREGTDSDWSAEEQYLYLPKRGAVDLQALRPLLEEMLKRRGGLTMEHAVDQQLLFGRLLSALQAGLRDSRQGSRSYQVAERVKRYLDEHYREPYSAERIADALHFNADYAARCLRKLTGMSPLQYHHHVRLEEAKRLLLGTSLPLTEVAEQVGFTDVNYFIRIFRQTAGVTPGAYRRSAAGFV
ncbi:AraC family transcriptional regulator [Paenibacillus filicis]|uniref:AraC family transcriptional regulator n=1 Tax=Paenibacillus gyeongsangnamensis TaxID=3388067 RepID=A0ABT4Q9E3_9BACL|nr:AraC family transcriptional regulator [Paenibacillus filicis]MCZ8513499.1 AraC family transcriptional regulator [Paenibacillus filicis]